MKTLCFAILFIGFAAVSQAQYYVTSVQGGKVFADGKELKKKDRITENASLRFSSVDVYVRVMAPGRGYFVLGVAKSKRSANSQGEFLVALKEAIFPPNEYPLPGIRSNEVEEMEVFEDQYDLKAYFRDDIFFVQATNFSVSNENFPLDTAHYFVIRHHLQDGWFARRLPQQGQQFELSADVFLLSGQAFPAETVRYSELYYVDETTGEEQHLGRFHLQFIDKEMLTEELTWLYSLQNQITLEEFYQMHALPHVSLEYGKTQPQQIEALMKTIKQ